MPAPGLTDPFYSVVDPSPFYRCQGNGYRVFPTWAPWDPPRSPWRTQKAGSFAPEYKRNERQLVSPNHAIRSRKQMGFAAFRGGASGGPIHLSSCKLRLSKILR